MQLVVKVSPDHVREGMDAIETTIAKLLRADLRRRTTISPIFPDVSSGRRAGLYTIELPNDIGDDQIEPLLLALRADSRLEYAHTAEPRRVK